MDLTETKHAQFHTNCTIPKRNKEKHPINQHAPNGNIGTNPCTQRIRSDHDGAIDEECHKGETQWARHDGIMNEKGGFVVAEVERGQV